MESTILNEHKYLQHCITKCKTNLWEIVNKSPDFPSNRDKGTGKIYLIFPFKFFFLLHLIIFNHEFHCSTCNTSHISSHLSGLKTDVPGGRPTKMSCTLCDYLHNRWNTCTQLNTLAVEGNFQLDAHCRLYFLHPQSNGFQIFLLRAQ